MTEVANIGYWLQGHCEICDYDLIGLPVSSIDRTVRCPECGIIQVKTFAEISKDDVEEIFRI